MSGFFFFCQAMRFLSHTVIAVNINITEEDLAKLDRRAQLAYHCMTADVVGDMMNRGAFYNTCGIRCYYCCFPLIAWLAGPFYLIGSSVFLVVILRLLDFNVNISKRELTKKRDILFSETQIKAMEASV
jgi:uncharacterized membrane protein